MMLAGCGTEPAPPDRLGLRIVSGDKQEVPAGSVTAQEIVVRAEYPDGRPNEIPVVVVPYFLHGGGSTTPASIILLPGEEGRFRWRVGTIEGVGVLGLYLLMPGELPDETRPPTATVVAIIRPPVVPVDDAGTKG